jgi:hypothetical protein
MRCAANGLPCKRLPINEVFNYVSAYYRATAEEGKCEKKRLAKEKKTRQIT